MIITHMDPSAEILIRSKRDSSRGLPPCGERVAGEGRLDGLTFVENLGGRKTS